MNTPKLKLFSDPYLLRQIDRPLLTKFFERFTHLLPSKYFLPNPRPDNEAYFDSLASVLERTCELPDDLAKALPRLSGTIGPNAPLTLSPNSPAAFPRTHLTHLTIQLI